MGLAVEIGNDVDDAVAQQGNRPLRHHSLSRHALCVVKSLDPDFTRQEYGVLAEDGGAADVAELGGALLRPPKSPFCGCERFFGTAPARDVTDVSRALHGAALPQDRCSSLTTERGERRERSRTSGRASTCGCSPRSAVVASGCRRLLVRSAEAMARST